MVEVREVSQRFDGARHFLVPLLVSVTIERFLAEHVLVGVALTEAVMRELEMRAELSIDEDCRAESCAEGDDHLDALAANGAKPLYVGVILDPHWFAQPPTQRSSQVEAAKAIGAEVERGAQHPMSHDAREPDRYAIEATELLGDIDNDVDELSRREVVRRLDAHAVVQHASARVEHGAFDVRAADVDRECERGRFLRS